jgi:predicted nucleic acid-binding protein
MRRVIISDTSCLIILTKINELNLLQQVYGQVTVTPEIVQEFGQPLPEWIEIATVGDKKRQQLLEFQIDKGESSAIALAMETTDCLLILDDVKARKIAVQLGLIFTGTMGFLIKAKQLGIIDSVKPLINKLQAANFRLSSELIEHVLRQANEL